MSEMRQLLEEFQVLFFPVQDGLELRDYLAFGRAMGELEVSPVIPSLTGEFLPIQVIDSSGGYAKGEFASVWHLDTPFQPCSPYATILRPEFLPPLSGDTFWARMYTAYEGMADSLRRFADSLEMFQAITVNGVTREYV